MSDLAVSVVIPTYNRARLLPRTVRSALAAVSPGDEILVVDDASTDDTAAVVATEFGERIRYIRLAKNGGAGAARNHGVRLATKPLVAFLDSDDEWTPDKLVLQRQLLRRRPDVLFCCGDFGVREADGTEVRRYMRLWHDGDGAWEAGLPPALPYSTLAPLPPGRDDFPVHIGDLSLAEMESQYVCTITVLVRRAEAGDALRFAEDLPVSEDKECFARLARRGPAAYLVCETAWNHGHPGPRLTDADAYALADARLKLLERVWGGDADFLARHGDRYAAVVARQHRRKAVYLLARGRTREARQEYHLAGGAPWGHRLLARLPGPLVRGVLGLRRALFRREGA